MTKITINPEIQKLIQRLQAALSSLQDTQDKSNAINSETEAALFTRTKGKEHRTDSPALYEKSASVILDFLICQTPHIINIASCR